MDLKCFLQSSTLSTFNLLKGNGILHVALWRENHYNFSILLCILLSKKIKEN